jgi:transposase InsO family protein
MQHKSEVPERFKEFKSAVEPIMKTKIKTLRTDNGGEYMSKEFKLYLKENGIRHETTVPYNPEQNGIAERKNGIIIDAIRAMIK